MKKTVRIKESQLNNIIKKVIQEQGEAQAMLNVFKGIWWKENYILLYSWICLIQVIICCIILISGLIIWSENNY